MYLCLVFRKRSLTIKNKQMNKELEERIERKKKAIADYMRVAKALGFSKEDIDKQVDIFLSDLSKLMKQRPQD